MSITSLGDCEICQTAPAEVVAVREAEFVYGTAVESLEMCAGCLEGMESEGFSADG